MLRPNLLLLLLLLNLFAQGQTAITDSLRHKLWQETDAEPRLQLLLALCHEQHSLDKDTAYKYAGEAFTLAGNSNDRNKSLAALYFARSYNPWGWMDSALAVLQPVLRLNRVEDPQTRDIYFLLQREVAMLYGTHTRYKDALKILYRLVNEGEKFNDPVSLASNMNSIGSVAIAREQPKEAMKWLYKALSFCSNSEKFIQPRAAIYINLANASLLLNRKDSALLYLKKAIPLAERSENLYLLSTALRVQTNAFVKDGNLEQAEKSFKALHAVKAKTNMSNIADDNLATVDFFISIQEFDKAIALSKQLLDGGQSMDKGNSPLYTTSVSLRLPLYEALAKCYKLTGQHQLYTATLEEVMLVKDSVDKEASAKEIAAIEAGYEARIKENAIIARQRLDITRKNYLFYGLLAFSLLAAISAIIIFNQHRRRQKIKMDNAVKEEKRLAEEGIKKAEEKERVRIAADLHDNLGVYAASMASNLSYLKSYKQEEGAEDAVRELTNNSGLMIAELNDTIWALKKQSLSLTAISDRTKIFINRLSKSYPAINIEVLEKIEPDVSFSASQSFHLYRIIQETVNNAVKHSGGRNIIVNITAGDTWRVTISDDGRGMIIQEGENRESNGLNNMKTRCRENGWAIEWKTSPPNGTMVEVRPT